MFCIPDGDGRHPAPLSHPQEHDANEDADPSTARSAPQQSLTSHECFGTVGLGGMVGKAEKKLEVVGAFATITTLLAGVTIADLASFTRSDWDPAWASDVSVCSMGARLHVVGRIRARLSYVYLGPPVVLCPSRGARSCVQKDNHGSMSSPCCQKHLDCPP